MRSEKTPNAGATLKYFQTESAPFVLRRDGLPPQWKWSLGDAPSYVDINGVKPSFVINGFSPNIILSNCSVFLSSLPIFFLLFLDRKSYLPS